MATGNAVIATSNAAEGIICNKNEGIIIEDEEYRFAEKTINLLKNDPIKIKLGKKAMQNIKKNYAWDNNLNEFDKLLKKINITK